MNEQEIASTLFFPWNPTKIHITKAILPPKDKWLVRADKVYFERKILPPVVKMNKEFIERMTED